MNTYKLLLWAHKVGHIPAYMPERWSSVNRSLNPCSQMQSYVNKVRLLNRVLLLSVFCCIFSLGLMCYGLQQCSLAFILISSCLFTIFLSFSLSIGRLRFIKLQVPDSWNKYVQDLDNFMLGFCISDISCFDEYPDPHLLQLVITNRFKDHDVVVSLNKTIKLRSFAFEFGFTEKWNDHP